MNLFMVEDAAGLDCIKDKVAKRTEEIISRVEGEKSVQICVKSHEFLVQQELKVVGPLPVLQLSVLVVNLHVQH